LPLFFAVAAVGSGIHAGKCNISQLVMQTIKNPPQTPPALSTAAQLASAFQMTPPQIWRLARQGRIPVLILGRRTYRFNIAEVAEALAAQTSPAVFSK
jgi:predicted DNA-binding transcriptional regulator AlpA